MFDADVFVLEFFGFIKGSDQQFIETLGNINTLVGRCIAGDTRDPIQTLLNFCLQQVRRNAGLFHQARYKTLLLFQQSKGKMFDIYCLMLMTCANCLRLRQRGLGFFREFVQVHKCSTSL